MITEARILPASKSAGIEAQSNVKAGMFKAGYPPRSTSEESDPVSGKLLHLPAGPMDAPAAERP